MRVLVIKASALGDVIHALPVLAWLKSADPRMEIDWLVEESYAPVLDGHPLLRKVSRIATRDWRRRGWRTACLESLRTVRSLRAEKYDVVLDLQGNSKSGLFTLLSGARRRYGFDRSGVRERPNLLATNRKVALTAAEHHISERSLAVARAAFPDGCACPPAGPLPVRPEASAQVEARLAVLGLAAHRLAVLHYGTTWPTKLWPVASWQELVRQLTVAGDLTIIMTWGNEAERVAVEQIRGAGGERVIVWPRVPLPELVALLARADIVVGGDTGPVHIAAAVDTPTVSLYRVTDARRNGPRGDRHICLQSPLACAPCLRKACERDQECGLSIPVAAVGDAVMQLLGPARQDRCRPTSGQE